MHVWGTKRVVDQLLVQELGKLSREELAGVVGMQGADHAFLFARAFAEARVEFGDEVACAPGPEVASKSRTAAWAWLARFAPCATW